MKGVMEISKQDYHKFLKDLIPKNDDTPGAFD